MTIFGGRSGLDKLLHVTQLTLTKILPLAVVLSIYLAWLALRTELTCTLSFSFTYPRNNFACRKKDWRFFSFLLQRNYVDPQKQRMSLFHVIHKKSISAPPTFVFLIQTISVKVVRKTLDKWLWKIQFTYVTFTCTCATSYQNSTQGNLL